MNQLEFTGESTPLLSLQLHSVKAKVRHVSVASTVEEQNFLNGRFRNFVVVEFNP
jgi:hypothetical protein